jgi:hypothetical protein
MCFQPPTKVAKKPQGNQQLQLWIKRTKLLFETYTDVPTQNDQQRNITQWLQEWGYQSNETTTATMLREYNTKCDTHSDAYSTDEEDDGEVRTKFSQMNLTSWLKSWGSEKDWQDMNKQSIQSNGVVRSSSTNTLD